jgi:hypothetical protein
MGYQYVRAVVMVKQLRYAINAYRHWSCETESRSDEVYSIKHYVIKFFSDLRQVDGFLRLLLHQ